MKIDWFDSPHPSRVVGTAPDGGFFVHASHHPHGTQGAFDCAKRAGVHAHERGGEYYFPLPWIRSEQTRALRRGRLGLGVQQAAGAFTGLDEKLVFVQELANVGRSVG